jgi:dTDP-4-dehydrorhamnose 3,5-epimerase
VNRVETSIPDVVVVEPAVYGDQRGFFLETWQQEKFDGLGLPLRFVQDNHSRSVQGTLRGLHFQVEQPQGKLVRVVRGAIFDVAVDLRRSSPTFGQWVGATLTDETLRALWVPPGFAHGFYVLSEVADVYYKCTTLYSPRHERSLRWDDPTVGIEWPLVGGRPPLLSPKDAAGLRLDEVADSYP